MHACNVRSLLGKAGEADGTCKTTKQATMKRPASAKATCSKPLPQKVTRTEVKPEVKAEPEKIVEPAASDGTLAPPRDPPMTVDLPLIEFGDAASIFHITLGSGSDLQVSHFRNSLDA